MNGQKREALYEDRLLRITASTLTFKHFYFPCGARRVNWHDIENVTAQTPQMTNEKWRWWGNGDWLSRIWFSFDARRATREVIFHLKLRGHDKRIGFTAENAACVEEILRRNNIAVIHEPDNSPHHKLSSFA